MNTNTFRRGLALWSVLCFALVALAQAPSGYYSAAKGKSGKNLKTALYGIVADHTQRSYKQLWTDFKTTDVRPDGKIWDMYSNVTNYEPGGSAQGANYSGEGTSYNREHSFPKSWFNDATPMYTDLFHLYPTDGYVNNRRSNYPFGETDGEKYQSAGGFSKLGTCTLEGYSGIVFEPADEYKGDFARTYFYMATAYENKIGSWTSDMLSGDSYPAYKTWALQMLLRWAKEDPVSEKETARNNAVYGIQGNRNPYIDFPGLEQFVWGDSVLVTFDPDHYTGINDSTVTPDPDPEPDPDPTPTPTPEPSGTTVYALVTSTAALQSGQQVLVVCPSQETALAAQSKDVRSYASITIAEAQTISTETSADGLPYALTLTQSGTQWTLFDAASQTYLALTSDANKLHEATDATSSATLWTISIASDGTALISSVAYPARAIKYNASAPRFACYKQGQKDVALFAQATDTGLSRLKAAAARQDVYDAHGRRVRTATSEADALNGLAPGIYIIGGTKVLIK